MRTASVWVITQLVVVIPYRRFGTAYRYQTTVLEPRGRGRLQNLLSSRLLSKNLKIKIYRTIILPVVLYGGETWSLTLREERKLRVFENMVLRRIFGPRRDEVTGEWRSCKPVVSQEGLCTME